MGPSWQVVSVGTRQHASPESALRGSSRRTSPSDDTATGVLRTFRTRASTFVSTLSSSRASLNLSSFLAAAQQGVAADELVGRPSASLWRSQLNAGTLGRHERDD